MKGAYNRCKLPRLTIGGSEGEKVSNVDAGDGGPTIKTVLKWENIVWRSDDALS